MRETEKMAGSGYVAAGERRSARRLDAYSAPATPPVVPVASSAPVKTVADKRELQKLRRDLETKKALERWRSRAARGPLTPDELAQLFADGLAQCKHPGCANLFRPRLRGSTQLYCSARCRKDHWFRRHYAPIPQENTR
jgi:predicted RNA-binding Zn ribbon-like protein